MKSTLISLFLLMVLYQVGESRNWHSKGRNRPAARPIGSRLRNRLRRLPENCEGVTCPDGMECQMEQGIFCQMPNCMFPICVKTGDVLVSVADNAGVCPMSSVDTPAGCSGDEAQECTNDLPCAINQKCCVEGCALQCVNVTSFRRAENRLIVQSRVPVMRLPEIPMRNAEGKMNRRGSRNAYYCPTLPGDAFSGTCNQNTCQTDEDCEGNQRCCMAGCGKRCLNPIAIMSVDGVRQDIRTPRRGFRQRGRGRFDVAVKSNVSAAQTPDVTSKPGVCPTIAVDANVTGNGTCVDDADCSGAMKCCAYGTGFGCFDPFNLFLPTRLMSSRLTLEQINGNERDLLRIRGMCPTSVQGFTCTQSCNADSNCTANQLCCTIGGCQECISPVISATFMQSRPGLCPSFSPDFGSTCDFQCNEDNDCGTEGMKCCSAGCGKRCVNPIATPKPMIKAGTCPAVDMTSDFMRCRFVRARFCRTDADCPGTRKCCTGQCNRYKTCQEAV